MQLPSDGQRDPARLLSLSVCADMYSPCAHPEGPQPDDAVPRNDFRLVLLLALCLAPRHFWHLWPVILDRYKSQGAYTESTSISLPGICSSSVLKLKPSMTSYVV